MFTTQTIQIAGKRLVVMEEGQYEQLCREAGKVAAAEGLPAWPKPDAQGRYPALEYARISLARSLIRERKSVGLSQQQLAALAGVRQETISRLESGKHTASVRTVSKIDRALKRAARRQLRTG